MWNPAPIELTSCLQRPLLPKKKVAHSPDYGPLAADINIDIGKAYDPRIPGLQSVPKYSIVTTCKGRLAHLQQTLPHFLEFPETEVIVVDYACPEKAGDWVESSYPSAKVIRMPDERGFNLPRARNHGAEKATGDTLLFFDADIIVSPALFEDVSRKLKKGTYGVFGASQDVIPNDLRGSFAVSRSDFKTIEGYDEVMVGYVQAELDLFMRLSDIGLERVHLNENFVQIISHNDELRTKFYADNKRKSQLVGLVYRRFMRMLRRLGKKAQADKEIRTLIFQQSASLVEQLIKSTNPSQGLKIVISIPTEQESGKFGHDFQILESVSLTISPKDAAKFMRRYQS
jgi:glycosyltransferase involved in cell wall biosynthesis